MTAFAIGAALMLGLAAWLLRPAWRPAIATTSARPAHLGILGEQLDALDKERAAGQLDAAQHQTARHELQRRVLDESTVGDQTIGIARSPKTLVFVGLAVPLFVIALYGAIGNPAGLDAQPPPAAAQAPPEPEVSSEAVHAMLASLAQQLDKLSGNSASDLQGWTMLARTYAALRRFSEADCAYARAVTLAPNDAQLLADRADVLAVLQGQRTAGEPDRLIAEALRIDPKNLKALVLAGSAAFERKDFTAASTYWQKSRQLAPDGGEFATRLDRSLAAAREAGAAVPTTAASSIAGRPVRITGRVSLSSALAAKAAPTDTVFVVARTAESSRMPLAIVRRTVADLPFDFTLDDTLAMSPQTTLSGASRVIVGARVSRSGKAMPRPGDLRGESGAIGASTRDLDLLIDSVHP